MLLLDKIEELFVVLVAENSTVKIGMIIDLILNFSCNFPSHFLYFIFCLYFFILDYLNFLSWDQNGVLLLDHQEPTMSVCVSIT
jgi:hypothetical protein